MQEIKLISHSFEDYSLIDSGEGYRLERYGDVILSKPDPQAVWQKKTDFWKSAQLIFKDGQWAREGQLPEKWLVQFKNLHFVVKPTPFKHLGLFPEQAVHWEWIEHLLSSVSQKREIKVLNLFGYTGALSVVAASQGAKVTHIDASKSSLEWVKENEQASGLSESPIRIIQDDCLKFLNREIKRGNKYDIVIADPPAFGHGASNEVWKFNEGFPDLVKNIKEVLSPQPLAVLINAYAISASSLMLSNVLADYFPSQELECGEVVINEETGRVFSTGLYAKWQATINH